VPEVPLPAGLAAYTVSTGLLLKQWDGAQAVVFHPATNSTHLMDEVASCVLAALVAAEVPVCSAQPAALVDTLGTASVEATLDALLQVGLVRRRAA